MDKKPIDISLSHLPLRPSSMETLHMAGYLATSELLEAKESGGIATIAAELQVSSQEALSIFQEVLEALKGGNNRNNNNNNNNNNNGKIVQTARSILQQNSARTVNGHIITFCRELDQILGGGIPLTQVSEIVGPPGSGKTMLATQLAVNVALPPIFGGVDGTAIYIDTEGSFSPERCYTMAEHLIRHIQEGVKRRKQQQPHHHTVTHHDQPKQQQQQQQQDVLWQATPEDILERIHVYRVHSVLELIAVLEALDEIDPPLFLRQCRLLVIDSIALPFRAMPADVARTRLLATVAAQLTQWAHSYDLAVVCINQSTITTNTTTSMTGSGKRGGGGGVALGETWAHAVANRLTISSTLDDAATAAAGMAASSPIRQAILVKSARMPISTAEFQVTEAGIRGLDYVVANDNKKPKKPGT